MSYPAFPPASIWLASVTSLDQTSNCHLRSPRTPQWTRPLWIPTLMFTLTPVTSLTSLQSHTYGQAIVKIKALVTKTAFFSHSICDFIGDNLCTGNVSDIRLFTLSWFHPLCDVIKPGITTTNHQTQLGGIIHTTTCARIWNVWYSSTTAGQLSTTNYNPEAKHSCSLR